MFSTKNRGFLIAGALLVVASANAQQIRGRRMTEGDKPNAVRLGIFWPTNTDLKNATTTTWFCGGLDHVLDQQLVPFGQYRQSISVDYFEKSGNRSIPVVLNFHGETTNGLGFFAGIGAVDTRLAGNNDQISYVLNVGANYDLNFGTTPLMLQAKYVFTGREEFRGFAVFVGARF